MENKTNKSPSALAQGITIALVILVLFFSGNFIGSLGGTPDTDTTEDTQAEEVIADATTQPTTQPTTAPTTQPTTQAPTASADTDEPATDDPATDVTSSGEMSKAEIVALFNESANKVKTDATKVVKNYEDREHLEEYLEMPAILESMAGSLMSTVFKDDVDPIEYATKEDIVANYQVPGQTWVSQLTEADVEEATCVDNGTEYEVMLKLYPTKDPADGVGVAKAFDTITPGEIKESAPAMLQEFSTEYFDCVVKCKIDKATGHTTWANYKSPLIMDVVVSFAGTHNARMGLSFEKDYTITY